MINRRVFLNLATVYSFWVGPFIKNSYAYLNKHYKEIMLIGDSHVGGLNPKLMELIRAPVIFKSKGINGSSIRSWVNTSRSLNSVTNPALVLICLGTNDALVDHPEVLLDDAKTLVSILRSKNYNVIWITPPHIDSKLPRLHLVRELIAKLPVTILDSSKFSVETQPDGIHLTQRGYNQWSECIHQVMSKMHLI